MAPKKKMEMPTGQKSIAAFFAAKPKAAAPAPRRTSPRNSPAQKQRAPSLQLPPPQDQAITPSPPDAEMDEARPTAPAPAPAPAAAAAAAPAATPAAPKPAAKPASKPAAGAPQPATAATATAAPLAGSDADVGKRIKVLWPADKAWYEGEIAGFNPALCKHLVVYEDGDEEWLDLAVERFKIIAAEGGAGLGVRGAGLGGWEVGV
jgi:DNA mismatch repair protein MSH6